jgi:kexin
VNEQKTGRFIAWSLQLWGECVDPSQAKMWQPAEYGEPDEEEIGSDPTATYSKKPKPTDHLPDDHASASGEADQPGLERPTATPAPPAGGDKPESTPVSGEEGESEIDGGVFNGVKNLASNSTWLASAGAIMVIFGASIGAFFYFRARNRRRNLFGLANDGEGARGAYAPVSEDVPMGLLARGRNKLSGKGGAGGRGTGAGGSKELYDAFGDGPSDDSESDDGADGKGGRAGLRYHDNFLEDEGEEREEYTDDNDQPERLESGTLAAERGGSGTASRSRSPREGQGSGSASSESWQDAAEDLRRG